MELCFYAELTILAEDAESRKSLTYLLRAPISLEKTACDAASGTLLDRRTMREMARASLIES